MHWTPQNAGSFTLTAVATDNLNSKTTSEPITISVSDVLSCSETSNAADQGSFSTGYKFKFETVGTNVTITCELLDSDKQGVVAFLWKQSPFSESSMTNVSGLTFSKTLTGQSVGSTINCAVKFAYAGGMSVTKYFSYVVGTNCPPLAIDDSTINNSLVVYPNPASDIIKISSKLPINKIQVYSLSGKIILETQKEISVKNLPTGMYLLKIYSGNQIVTKKLLVK